MVACVKASFVSQCRLRCCTTALEHADAFSQSSRLTCKSPQKQVDPRGLEPLASAIRGRRESFAVARYRSKNRSNTPNPWIVPPQMFAAVRAGCRQTVVNCRRACTEWASVLLVHFISCGKPACPYFFPSSDPVVPIIAVRFVWSSLAQFVVNPVCEYLS
jgi:hypothetical protein